MPKDSQQTWQISLLELLEQGCIPWRRPRKSTAMGHRNLVHGRPYKAADALLLEVVLVQRGLALPWWCTYMEARQAGLTPRKGSQGVHLGWADQPSAQRERPPVVFNVADMFGQPLQRHLAARRVGDGANRQAQQQRLANAEQRLNRWCVPVREGRYLPGYQLQADEILLPSRHNFHCREAFLATWACTQIRSTGHPKRLAEREYKDSVLNRQEFVMELAWIMWADRLGLGRQYGVFVLAASDWTRMLQPSPNVLIELITQASQAVDLLAATSRS
ncbi:MAG: ArdC-like ssDNA-binding domain-containing protein [Cyanobium sp.]